MKDKDLPKDYAIGWTDFLGIRIDLRYKPLIPRVETIFWIERELPNLKDKKRILDIFSGSGCLGLYLLKNIPNAKVDFSDISENCIKQIKYNLKINKLKANKVILSDIFENISDKYDLIVANPPYVPSKRKLPASVVKYESDYVYAGIDGLKYILPFLEKSLLFLKKGGILLMEIDDTQKTSITKILKKCKISNFEFLKDQYQRIRVLKIYNGGIEY